MRAHYPIDAVNLRSAASIVAVVVLAGYFFRGGASREPLMIAMLLAAAAIGLVVVQLFAVRARIEAGSLSVGGGLYTLRIALQDVYPERAVFADKERIPALVLRSNGISLPGLSLGWFVSSDRTKVFGALADRRKAILLPTSRGFDIVLSPRDPKAFVSALSRAKSALR